MRAPMATKAGALRMAGGGSCPRRARQWRRGVFQASRSRTRGTARRRTPRGRRSRPRTRTCRADVRVRNPGHVRLDVGQERQRREARLGLARADPARIWLDQPYRATTAASRTNPDTSAAFHRTRRFIMRTWNSCWFGQHGACRLILRKHIWPRLGLRRDHVFFEPALALVAYDKSFAIYRGSQTVWHKCLTASHSSGVFALCLCILGWNMLFSLFMSLKGASKG